MIRYKSKNKYINLKKQIRKNINGITLIALVVTIVVLLILAGITINLLFSDTGLLGKAQETENAWRNAENSDIEAIGDLVNQANEMLNGIGTGGSETGGDDQTGIEKWDGTTNEKVTAVPSLDEPSINVPVPKGFTASTIESEQTVEGGFVIYQGETKVNADDIENEQNTRNQFVWIPVDEASFNAMYEEVEPAVELSGETGVATSIYSKSSIYTRGKPGGTGYREPDLVIDYDTNSSYYSSLGLGNNVQEFAQKMVNEYKEIHDSIYKYGGFYIGRYELTGTTSSPTVAKGGTVITNTDWYNLKTACISLVDDIETTAKTTMIYGNQWDEVCNWLSDSEYDINDSSSWGNHSNYNEESGENKQVDKAGEKTTAGYSEYWKANNIYDLAGNCWEWTQEADNTLSRVARGGDYVDYGFSSPVSDRTDVFPDTDVNSNLSARPTLYISSTEQ